MLKLGILKNLEKFCYFIWSTIKDYEKSLIIFELKIAVLDEKVITPRYNQLGCLYVLQRKFDKAESMYLKALELNSQNINAKKILPYFILYIQWIR
jgi:tetratricopeptide (TPR) repeat protein